MKKPSFISVILLGFLAAPFSVKALPIGTTTPESGIQLAPSGSNANPNPAIQHKPQTGPANYNTAPTYVVEPNLLQCTPSNVNVCGTNLPVPLGSVGSVITLALPKPYQPQPVTVQCVYVNGITSYQIVSPVNCALPTCPPSPVNVCGASVEVPATIPLGSTVKVEIPTSYLTDTTYAGLSVTAACVDNGGPQPNYQVADPSTVSCTLFPCPESHIRLCDTEIPLHGGTPLGGVLHLTMPKPFAADPFTVQCVGSAANPPTYQLTDHDSVSCSMVPTGQ